jgi:hypothetical protein
MLYKNSKFNEFGDIDMEVNHPVHGWIPFTASAKDEEEHGRKLYASAFKGADPYVAPPEPEVPEAIPATLSERNAEVDIIRDQKIAEGMPFNFSNGIGVVQLRHEKDIRNIQGRASAGLALSAMGDTTTVLTFRDAADVTHPMTARDAIVLGLSASQFISENYEAAWNHKDIMVKLTPAELAVYDVTTGWTS